MVWNMISLRSLNNVDELSHPVTEEFLRHVRATEVQNRASTPSRRAPYKLFQESRTALGIPTLSSLFDITRQPRRDRHRAAFLKEWNATLQFLRDISKRVTGHRPVWINQDAPAGAQTDQFLHAFYYNRVSSGPICWISTAVSAKPASARNGFNERA